VGGKGEGGGEELFLGMIRMKRKKKVFPAPNVGARTEWKGGVRLMRKKASEATPEKCDEVVLVTFLPFRHDNASKKYSKSSLCGVKKVSFQ